jgi:hypothetical protein
MKVSFKGKYSVLSNGTVCIIPTKKLPDNLPDSSKEINFVIEDVANLGQNNILHAYFSKIADFTGNDMEDIKAYLKHLYLGYETKVIGGEKFSELRRTRDLSMTDKAKFITQVEQWAWHELQLPLNETAGTVWG